MPNQKSGYRRYKGDWQEITDYLNNIPADIMAIPYSKSDYDSGRHHHYDICYIDKKHLSGLNADGWKPHGKQYKQSNKYGVDFSISPSMSWQIWWAIPVSCIETSRSIEI